jgi:acyl-homoserine-lactone acylase
MADLDELHRRVQRTRGRTMRLKSVALAALVAATLASGVLQGAPLKADGMYRATIVRTAYGAPHITAADYGSLGFGAGYAGAQDNFCDFADRMLTVTAELARYLGPGEKNANVISDLYHQRLIQTGRLEQLLNADPKSLDRPSVNARALLRGYVAGVNRYLRDTGVGALPAACKGAPWVRPYNEIDMWRSTLAGRTPVELAGVAGAAPPGGPEPIGGSAFDAPADIPQGQGSNAYALGREATKTGHGALLGNPHYPWDGLNRFTRLHLIIPGNLNIVGAGLENFPLVVIGHNQWVAWTHTVSTARRFGMFELTLDAKDPTAYLYEGKTVPMSRMSVTVQVKTDKGLTPVTRTYYATRYGPMVETPQLPWTKERAYALRAAPVNLRGVDQYLAMWQAHNVRELAAALSRYQGASFNTIAVDKDGDAFYGDIGSLPYVTDAKAKACATSPTAKAAWEKERMPILDGSRAVCDWDSDPKAATKGVFPASALPQIYRADFTANSNDSYWLSNPNQPLTGYGRIFGDEGTARSLRTRLGLKMIADRAAGADGLGAPKFDLATIEGVVFNDRNLGAEMTRGDLLDLCRREAAGAHPELARACEALAGWDQHVNLDSRGAQVFRLFAEKGGLKFKVAFDPNDPVNTPNTLDADNPAVLKALLGAVAELDRLHIPLDASLGQVQTEPRNAEAIPIHGGPGSEGIFNVIASAPPIEGGWRKVREGSSWIMAVEFTDHGPISQGVLSYSQSTNPASPHFGDQTKLYSQKGWDDLCFTPEAVKASAVSTLALTERIR